EDLDRRVDVDRRAKDVGMELDVLERLPGTGERQLPLRRTVRVVERGLRRPALRDLAQVGDGERGVEATLAAVELGLFELHELQELGGPGELASDHGVPF